MAAFASLESYIFPMDWGMVIGKIMGWLKRREGPKVISIVYVYVWGCSLTSSITELSISLVLFMLFQSVQYCSCKPISVVTFSWFCNTILKNLVSYLNLNYLSERIFNCKLIDFNGESHSFSFSSHKIFQVMPIF